MIYIEKDPEPFWLSEFKQKNPDATYDSEEFKRTTMRADIRKLLLCEQHGLCAYCCGKIGMENSHNEHIEPRHPKCGISYKSLDYDNMVASCNNRNTCGEHKGNDYEADKFVSPLSKECEAVFSYGLDGMIDGDEYTIRILNLNEYELKNARKAVYHTLVSMSQYMSKEQIAMVYEQSTEEYIPFRNVVTWYLNSLEA